MSLSESLWGYFKVRIESLGLFITGLPPPVNKCPLYYFWQGDLRDAWIYDEPLKWKIKQNEEEGTDCGFPVVSLTLICLFSSLSLWASICSLLHSSMIFFTSPSSRVELSDLKGSEEDSDFSKLDDIILLDSVSCWEWVTGERVRICALLLLKCFYGNSEQWLWLVHSCTLHLGTFMDFIVRMTQACRDKVAFETCLYTQCRQRTENCLFDHTRRLKGDIKTLHSKLLAANKHRN